MPNRLSIRDQHQLSRYRYPVRFELFLLLFVALLVSMDKVSPFKALKIINVAKKGVAKAEWKDKYRTLYKTGFRISSGLYSQKTGAFKSRLPDIFEGPTHYRRAKKELRFVKYDGTIKNERNKSRKHTAQSMDTVMKGLTKPITEILNSYKQIFKTLHPFEATVAELTVAAQVKSGGRHVDDILGDLKTLRMTTSQIGKEYASKGANAESAMEAKNLHDEGMSALEDLYHNSKLSHALAEMMQLQKNLRRIPVVELDTPTVVLVGAPNVGKSSIVCAVSSGTPEVNDYPFTTRGVTIGHIVDAERFLRFQVMDTPGLLDRPEEERNEMEKLTFASLLHLPTAVIFVIDPSGLSGEQSNLDAQLNVRKYLRERFPKRPWLDVISKADLELSDGILEKLPKEALFVSTKDGKNVEELRYSIEYMMGALREMLIERGFIVREEVIDEMKTNLL